MTERGSAAIRRSADSFAIGPSAVSWDGTSLRIDIDEVTVPIPGRVRGTVRVHPIMVTDHVERLDAAGRHRWWPVAPASRVAVELSSPSLCWSGPGYFDSNWGDAPLESDFPDWDWCRTALGPGGREGAAILYDVRRRDGTGKTVPIHIRPDGSVEPFAAPPRVTLPRTSIWRVPRETGCEPGGEARVSATFLDAPFYARSVVETRLLGRPVTAMHESLALDRFASGWVQMLLPFRMPRVAR